MGGIYVPRAYDYGPTGRITDIMLQQGRAQAEGAARSGEIWGNAIGQVGQAVGQAVQAGQERKAQTKRAAAFEAAIQSGDPQNIIKVLGPKDGPAVVNALAAHQPDGMKRYTDVRVLLRDQARGIKALPPEHRAQGYDFAIKGLMSAGIIKPGEAPEAYDENIVNQFAAYGAEPAKPQGLIDTAPGHALVDPATRQPVFENPAAAPKPPAPPDPGSFPDYMTATPERRKEIEAARKGYMQADDRPRVNVSVGGGDTGDVKDAIAGMMDGSLPPILPGRASKEYVALLGQAHRKGYNLAEAATDWAATQKHVATLNGAQFTRMTSAIDNASHSLDVIDNLAEKWKGGKFPLLNRAQLAAAKGGALGPQAQAIATQLEAQIADVTSELGNVYMGGNSPTDHSLALAAKNLGADFSEPTLLAMTKLARQNLRIRSNSIRNSGVSGASENNPYAPKQTAPGAAARPTATNAKGQKVEWDGTAWVSAK